MPLETIALLDELWLDQTNTHESIKLTTNLSKRVYDRIKKLRNPPVRLPPKEYSTEKRVREWLTLNQISFTQWFKFDENPTWEYDFLINRTNILIEVQGDYYHCNPVVYLTGPINEAQAARKRLDNIKMKFAKTQGMFIFYVWEQDINSMNDIVFNKLLKRISDAINNA